LRLLKLSMDWHDFLAKLNKIHPHSVRPTQLSFEYANEEDDGKGL
jgi:hypothetical protein